MSPITTLPRRAARAAWRRAPKALELARRRSRWRKFSPPYRLHIGCGTVRIEGWVNVDLDRTPAVDVIWDILDPFPLADGTCELIYTEHMLEHFSVEQGLAFLRETRRLLRSDGVLRVAMPSLDALVEKYNNGWQDQAWLRLPEYEFIKTPAEMLNVALRWWGHQWVYDREELHRRLTEAGFSKIRDVELGESDLEALKGLETRNDSLLIVEASP